MATDSTPALDAIDSWQRLNVDEKCGSTLWHYTDAAGLVGILKSGRLWATHVAHLNDPTEVIHGENLAEALGNNLAWPKAQANACRALKKFCEGWGDQRLSSIVDLFTVSFCQDDGNRLSQWRGYGGAGLGYSIGFKNVNIGPDSSSLTFKVAYEQGPSMKQLDKIFRKILIAIEDDISGGADAGRTVKKGVEKMSEIASLISLKLKHGGFKEEREWRLIAFASEPSEVGRISTTQYRAAKQGIVPYVEVNLTDKSNRLPIKRIFVGPAHDATASLRAVKGLLTSLNYPNPEELVQSSAIPFRPL